MKKLIFSLAIIFALGRAFGQSSTLIEPNGNNGIFSQNWTTVIAGPGIVTPPVSGTGTRLMWIPRKSAFRVGTVEGTEWDAANIGTWSTAFGVGTTASGGISTSMGYVTTASGSYSTSMGAGTTASGDFSTTMGYSTTASGNYSTSIGFGTTAQSFASLVLGRNNVVSGNTTTWVVTDPLFVVGNGADNANRNNALTLLKNGQLGIGTNSVATNELVQINGRLRLMRNAFASGLWLNNSANGTAVTDGAFIGLNNETAGSETAGFWLNGAFRWFVDRNGGTTQNSATISNLAGTGVRNVYADANGTLTTGTGPTSYYSIDVSSFVPTLGDYATFIQNYKSLYFNDNSSHLILAPINLPHGAVITNVTTYYIDNSTQTMQFGIYRSPITTSVGTAIVGLGNSTNGSTFTSVNLGSTIIDNSLYSYAFGVDATWDTSNLKVVGIKITYTL